MSTVAYPNIDIDTNGQPRIAGTGFKVRMLVEEHLATGADADELLHRHPQLTLAQIYGALVYYHDHKNMIDREIQELTRQESKLRPELETPETTARLRQAMSERKGRA